MLRPSAYLQRSFTIFNRIRQLFHLLCDLKNIPSNKQCLRELHLHIVHFLDNIIQHKTFFCVRHFLRVWGTNYFKRIRARRINQSWENSFPNIAEISNHLSSKNKVIRLIGTVFYSLSCSKRFMIHFVITLTNQTII